MKFRRMVRKKIGYYLIKNNLKISVKIFGSLTYYSYISGVVERGDLLTTFKPLKHKI